MRRHPPRQWHTLNRRGAAALAIVALSPLAAIALGADGPTSNAAVTEPHGHAGCMDPAPTGLTVFLLDLRKPLDPDRSAEPGELLQTVANGLPSGTELRVYGVASRAVSPIIPIARVCPLGPDERTVIDGTAEDACVQDEWHGADCRRFDAVRDRLAELFPPTDVPVDSAYLVEALERARNELAGFRGYTSLHVYSDLLQHAPWYSDFEPAPKGLEHAATSADTRALQSPGSVAEVFYVPRTGTTDTAADRKAHQHVWGARFAALGLAPVFRDLRSMRGYQTVPFADRSTRLGRLARERTGLRTDRLAAAEAAASVVAARERLRDALAQSVAERRRIETRAAELRTRQGTEQELIAAERAEIARLQAALSTRDDGRTESDQADR